MTRKYNILLLLLEYETKLTAWSLTKSQVFYLPEFFPLLYFGETILPCTQSTVSHPYVFCEFPPQITTLIHISSRGNSTSYNMSTFIFGVLVRHLPLPFRVLFPIAWIVTFSFLHPPMLLSVTPKYTMLFNTFSFSLSMCHHSL